MWILGDTLQPIAVSQLTDEKKKAWKSQLKSRNWWEVEQAKNPGILIPVQILSSILTTSSGVDDNRSPGCYPRNCWWEQSHPHLRHLISASGSMWSQLPAATDPTAFPSSSYNQAGLHQGWSIWEGTV